MIQFELKYRRNIYIGGNVLERMRRLLIFLCLGIFLINFTFAGDFDMSWVAVEGRVYDKVTEEFLDSPYVMVDFGGMSVQALNKQIDMDRGVDEEHPPGHYNTLGNDLPMYIQNVVVTARDKQGSNCYGVVTRKIQWGEIMWIDVPVCCYPTKAGNFRPADVIVGSESVDLSWVPGQKQGYAVDREEYDLWHVFNELGRDGEDVTDKTSLHVILGDVFGGWGVNTCNGIKNDGQKQCCSPASSSGKFNNNPCPPPWNLRGVYEKGGGFIDTTWESAEVDEDGHVCHDEWVGWSVDGSGEIPGGAVWVGMVGVNGSLPYANKVGEPAEAHLSTLWQVRSCDPYPNMNGCSHWVQAVMPSCNVVSGDCVDCSRVWRGMCPKSVGDIFERPLGAGVGVCVWCWIWLLIRLLAIAGIVFYEQDKVRKKRLKEKQEKERKGKIQGGK